MICPNCGAENPEGSEYCGLCHNRLPYIDHSNETGYPEWYQPENVQNVYSPIGATHIPKSRSRRLDIRKLLHSLSSILLVICFIAGAVFLISWFTKGKTTYSSSASKISFKYPRSWDIVTAGNISNLSALGFTSDDTAVFNEVMLADRKDENAKCFLGVMRIDGLPPNQDMQLLLSRWKLEMLPTISQSAGGISLKGASFNDTVLDGTYPGYHINGQFFDNETVNSNCEILLTTDGVSAYAMIMASDPDFEINKIFQDITASIKFAGSTPSSNISNEKPGAAPKVVK